MKRIRRSSEPVDYWRSYSDMMAALLLMFILIMAFTLLQSLKSYQDKLQEKEEQIIIQQQQQEQLEEQQVQLLEQKEQLDEQQNKIDSLIGIKTKLIEALSAEFKDTNMKIIVDQQTGAIVFDSNILFDYNKFELKASAKLFLKEFLPVYFNVLMNDEFEEYVSEIIIEGHTDQNGNYLYNLNLSQQRALSIASYCFEEDNNILSSSEIKVLRGVLTANGRSWSNLIYKDDGSIDSIQSRRVEFKFRLKDDEMIEEMKRILEE